MNIRSQFDHNCILLNEVSKKIVYYRSYKQELIKERQNSNHQEQNIVGKDISEFINKKLIHSVNQIFLENQSISPNSSESYQIIGVSLQEIRWFNEALMMYDKAIQINPNQAELYYFKGNNLSSSKGLTLFELGNLYESIMMYDKAITIQPGIAEFYFHKGFSFQGLENYNEAIQLYNQVIQINPNYQIAHLKKEICLQLIDDKQKAQDIQLQQKYYSYGDIYFKLGQVDKAIMMYLKATDLTYQKQETSLKLGQKQNPTNFQDQDYETDTETIISSISEIYDESTDKFDEYILINPNCAKSLIMNGNIFYLFGANDEAMKLYDKAIIQINHQNKDKNQDYGNKNSIKKSTRLKAISLFMKGRIYKSEGREPEADEYCIFSCELNPSLLKYKNSDIIPSLHKESNI